MQSTVPTSPLKVFQVGLLLKLICWVLLQKAFAVTKCCRIAYVYSALVPRKTIQQLKYSSNFTHERERERLQY